MKRPLHRKLALAVLKYLDTHKSGTALATLQLVTSAGTTLAQEAAFDADPASAAAKLVAEPQPPFLAVHVATTADADLPGVHTFELVLHLKTDATDDGTSLRETADGILRDAHDLITDPPNAAAWADDNPEGGALLAFVNKPASGPDARDGWRTPLHLYGIYPTTAPMLFEESVWHDQLAYRGHVQDMDSH